LKVVAKPLCGFPAYLGKDAQRVVGVPNISNLRRTRIARKFGDIRETQSSLFSMTAQPEGRKWEIHQG